MLKPTTIIQPTHGWVALELKEFWQYRELLFFLIWRDIKVRYKQTVLGAAWAILQPVMTMVVFSLFLGKLAGVPSDGVPYPVFSFSALVPWTLFSFGLAQGANSLVGSQNLIKKIYFPRLVIPVAAVLAGIADFALSFLVLFVIMFYYDVGVSVKMLWLPVFTALALITALAVALWLSAMNVQFRDIRYIVPFLTQLWLFATPVAYPSSLLSEGWRTLYAINPMVGVVEGFRWALLGTETRPGPMILASTAASFLLLISGLYYFRRMERIFADVV